MPHLSRSDKRAKVSLNEARRRKEIALARIREMEADEKAGKLSGAPGFSYGANNSWPPGRAAGGAVGSEYPAIQTSPLTLQSAQYILGAEGVLWRKEKIPRRLLLESEA